MILIGLNNGWYFTPTKSIRDNFTEPNINDSMTPEQQWNAIRSLGYDAYKRGTSPDYNLQAWMDRYGNDQEAVAHIKEGGHFNDVGKLLDHPTRSNEAAISEPLLHPGCRWSQAEDNVWEFTPGSDQQGLSALARTYGYLAYGNNHVKTRDDITRMVLPDGRIVSPR
jgi:hypothetical protein